MIKKEVLEKIKNELNLKNNKAFCERFGVNYNSLNTMIARDNISFELIEDVVNQTDLSYDFLLKDSKNSDFELKQLKKELQKLKEKLEELIS